MGRRDDNRRISSWPRAGLLAGALLLLVPGHALASAPDLELSASELDLGAVQTATPGPVSTVTATNGGDTGFDLDTITVAPGSDFETAPATGTNCSIGITLGPGDSCAIGVRFDPESDGSAAGTLAVEASNFDGADSAEVALSGFAAQPTFAVSPNTLAFGAQEVGTTSATRTFTVQSTSPFPIVMTLVTNQLDIGQNVVSQTCHGTTLAAANQGVSGDRCEVNISFTPGFARSYSGQIELKAQGASSAWLYSVTGQGVNPPVQGTLLADPSVFDFDTIYPGATADRDFTISAASNPVGVGDITVIGGSFQQVTPSAGTECVETSTLSAGQQCTIGVRFTGPASPGGGAAGTVLIENDGTSSPTLIALSGASAFPVLVLDVNSFDFGSVQTGSSSAVKTFTLTNYGQVATQPFVNPIAPAGQGFTKVSDTCHNQTLEAFGSGSNTCQIQVRFDPASAGAKSAQLVIASGAVTSPNTIDLSGTGAASQSTPPPATQTPPAAPRCKKGQKLKNGRCVKRKRKKR